jgi:hypothetical protein
MKLPPLDDQLVRQKVAAVERPAIGRHRIDLVRQVRPTDESRGAASLGQPTDRAGASPQSCSRR